MQKYLKLIFLLLLMACESYECSKIESSSCDPCLIPRSNIALITLPDDVSYYVLSNDNNYHIGKISSNTLTVALEKSDPDPTALMVLTRDTLVQFYLVPSKENTARIYKLK